MEANIEEISGTVTDHELLLESLRERCLYEKVAKDDFKNHYKTWYNYMVYLQTEIAYRKEFSKENSDNAFEFLEISNEEIEKCVNNSFDVPGDYQSENRILKEDRQWQNL